MSLLDCTFPQTGVVTIGPLCYNCFNILGRVVAAVLMTPEAVWKIFRATGSVGAYLLYRQLIAMSMQR